MARRELIQLLARIEPSAISIKAYRSSSPGYPPLSGEGARIHGGRWNPPDSFPVAYMATDVSGAAGEVLRTARRYGIEPHQLLPRILWTLDVRLGRVLDFTDPVVRDAAHIPIALTTDDDLRLCQAYGDAAHYIGTEVILAPSNASAASTLAIFVNRLGPHSVVLPVDQELLDTGDIT